MKAWNPYRSCCYLLIHGVDSLALYLEAQNAGIIIRPNIQGRVVFEFFELSATSESVVSTTGRLLRKFPGYAMACPHQTFSDPLFQAELTRLLCLFNCESVNMYKPQSWKDGKEHEEVRDTINPGLVSDYLMAIIGAWGGHEDVPSTQKFVRDDVLWDDTVRPWRRSPFWLFLRVSILRTLSASLEPLEVRKQYKHFMIQVVARLLAHVSKADVPQHLI